MGRYLIDNNALSTNFYNLLIILFAFALFGCIHVQRKPSSPEESIVKKDNQIDTTGILISKIDFKLKATQEDLKIFEDGIVPWISLDDPNKEMNRLVDADEIVLPFSKAVLIIDYPLTNQATFDLSTTEKGFTRKQLIRLISKKYHEIYREEEKTANTKTVPVDKRKGLINRNQTNGKYGVWGHDLSDLDLDSVEVHKNSGGKIFLILDVES